MPSTHNGLPWTENGPSLVMFFFLIIYLVIACAGGRFLDWFKEKGWIVRTIDDCDVDEDLGNYFECIPHVARKEWFTTEVYNRNILGIHKFGMGTFEELRTVHGKNKVLKNEANYDLLQNYSYATLFGYSPMRFRDCPEDCALSDFVC